MRRYLNFDYETYSEADLRLVGAYEYSMHPSTEILCVAFKWGSLEELKAGKAKIYTWSPLREQTQDQRNNLNRFINALVDDNTTLVAHNAYFERVITQNVLYRATKHLGLKHIPTEAWLCTASLAAALALPRHLEGVCDALGLPIQKDMEGKRLMMKWCKPRRPSKKNPSTRHTCPTELERLIEYCKVDVLAQTQLLLALPRLTPTERRVWCLDQEINLRGIKIDRQAATNVLGMVEKETIRLNKLTATITDGELQSTNQRDAALRWLKRNGATLPNLQAGTIKEALAAGLVSGKPKRLLEIRQAVSKTSTAKYKMFDQRTMHDGRLRDFLLYHGASTGRWSGSGVQPQNFPRGTLSKEEIAIYIDLIKQNDLFMIRLAHGEPLEVFSSCLRGMIIASEGTELHVADYASIEARVLFWVAKHIEGIKAFREGRPIYEEMAASIYGKKVTAIGKDSVERFVGKQATLGCGYQMGHKKFQETCRNFGEEISEALAKVAVDTYRSVHRPVVKLWSNLNLAALSAVENPGKRYTINYTTWYVRDNFLFCELPSKRRLAYYNPRITWEKTSWGDKRRTLSFWGVDSTTKRWARQKTYGGKLTENVVQAISRDIMAEAMLRVHSSGLWHILLTVHDEIIAERLLDKGGSLELFCELMATPPDWAKDCPIKVEGWCGDRYRK